MSSLFLFNSVHSLSLHLLLLSSFSMTLLLMLPHGTKRMHFPTAFTLNLPKLARAHMFLHLPQFHLPLTKNTNGRSISVQLFFFGLGLRIGKNAALSELYSATHVDMQG